MISFQLKISEKDLRIFDRISNFVLPANEWEVTLSKVQGFISEQIEEIKSAPISQKLARWRKSMARNNRSVETLRGQKNAVLDSSSTGERTGVLFDSILEKRSPGVEASLSISEVLSIYHLKVNSEKFVRKYPFKFEDHVLERGLVPDEGLLSIEEEDEAFILDSLERSVCNSLFRAIGAGI